MLLVKTSRNLSTGLCFIETGVLATWHICFEPLIGVKHLFERPPLKTVLAPAEKIGGPCPHRNRSIDDRASSDNLAANDMDRMANITRLTHVPPIMIRITADSIRVSQDCRELPRLIDRSRFQQQHVALGVLI